MAYVVRVLLKRNNPQGELKLQITFCEQPGHSSGARRHRELAAEQVILELVVDSPDNS